MHKITYHTYIHRIFWEERQEAVRGSVVSGGWQCKKEWLGLERGTEVHLVYSRRHLRQGWELWSHRLFPCLIPFLTPWAPEKEILLSFPILKFCLNYLPWEWMYMPHCMLIYIATNVYSINHPLPQAKQNKQKPRDVSKRWVLPLWSSLWSSLVPVQHGSGPSSYSVSFWYWLPCSSSCFSGLCTIFPCLQ